ncbi:gluconate 5-dehydrogenase [Virgibacillus subterraneus]|uniref:Gluconate 5-dehydrogenase n=1 Tax=Virgibacillus subterraneus TaxID=621109 RepID=A0A1H9G784_9BACI|nr:SDR family oxidoreductase [Virgibacillus subterraneus]SEQ45914.1 gluconate 5-dehydrogenase [Virgibacillus subterraneus]
MQMKEMFSLRGKTAVVTGGSGYLGSCMVEAMLAHGANVTVADPAEIPERLFPYKEKGKLYHVRCDVSDTESICNMFERSADNFGQLDILVNNANYGAGYGDTGIDKMSDKVWDIGIDGSVGTAFRCTRESISYLRQNGGGSIVNIASMYGMVSPNPGIYGSSEANNPPNYGAGKSGVIQLTRYCAGHLAKDNIRANSVSPGPFPKPSQEYDQDFQNNLADKTMLKRVGEQHEVAGTIVFLASSASGYVTGVNIAVDGGWTAW